VKKILSLSLILLCLAHANSQIVEKIEPPNWWVGMKNPMLEIMLYGKDIGALNPQIRQKGIKVINHKCPGSKNYLFVDLEISPRCKPGKFNIELFLGSQRIQTIEYSLMGRAPGSRSRVGYNSSDAIYLITPDRFANSDESNDNSLGMIEIADRGLKDGRHGGDIGGIRQHLDYISSLGFTALWINPLLENNMPKASYHGYAITDFYKVDSRMGTNEEYKTLCADSHKAGIKIIMDGVLNHCGLHHGWLQDPPTEDWINYFQEDYVETNHRKTLQPDPHAAPEDLEILEKGWFVPTMPDLNLANPFLAIYMIQNTIWWTEFSGIDGIRMDTYLYPDHTFMADWSKAVLDEYPNLNMTGEVWYDQPSVLAYWQKGNTSVSEQTSFLPSLFDFPLQAALIKSLTTDNSWGQGWIYLYEALALDFVYPDPDNLVVFADNHDMSRIYAQLGENSDIVKLAMAYVLTTRGIPEIYYGTEILMDSPIARDDGKVRSDFPGGWKGDSVNAFTGAGLTEDQKTTQLFISKILTWRKNATAIHAGKTTHFVPEHGVYVYFRYDGHQKIMIVLNKNSTPTTLDLDRFKNMIGENISGTDIISGERIALQGEIHLPKMGAKIIECR